MRDGFSLRAFPDVEFLRVWKSLRHNFTLPVFGTRCLHGRLYSGFHSVDSKIQSYEVLSAWIFRTFRNRVKRDTSAHQFYMQFFFANLFAHYFIYFLYDFLQIGQAHIELNAYAGERKNKLCGRML